jgi:hypothetical protein
MRLNLQTHFPFSSKKRRLMKRILIVLSCSQTGQLRNVLVSGVAPLRESAQIELVERVLEPLQTPPFPRPFGKLFDMFPETIHEVAPALKPFADEGVGPFDLVVLAYQVWFLSPAPAMTAFLQSEPARARIAGCPVVTIVACKPVTVSLATSPTAAVFRRPSSTLRLSK